jgi:hypothetical protein
MKTFDPDMPYVKIRGMGQVHYEQDGCKFSAGHKYVGRLDGKKDLQEAKEDVRARARAKVAKATKNKGSLDGFREKQTPDAVSSAVKENEAARQAEENV